MHSLLWSGIPDSDFLSNGKVNASFRKVRQKAHSLSGQLCLPRECKVALGTCALFEETLNTWMEKTMIKQVYGRHTIR